MIPWQVDPSWYEHYWLRARPARRSRMVLSTLMGFAGRAVDILQRMRRGNSWRCNRGLPRRHECWNPRQLPRQSVQTNVVACHQPPWRADLPHFS